MKEKERVARCRTNLLSPHTIPPTHGKWLECLLIIPIETFLVSRVAFGQKPFRMENARLHPVVRIVLNILQIYTNDILDDGQRSFIFYRYSQKKDALTPPGIQWPSIIWPSGGIILGRFIGVGW